MLIKILQENPNIITSYILKELEYDLNNYRIVDTSKINTLFKIQGQDNYLLVNKEDIFGQFLVENKGHEFSTVEEFKIFLGEGDLYVEVGANYGDFVLAVSDHIGSQGMVYAFEPSYSVFPYLEASIFINGKTNVVLENKAVSDSSEDVIFLIRDNNDSFGSLGSSIIPSRNVGSFVGVETKVPGVVLDEYFYNNPYPIDMLRVDAEGSECKVLRGSRESIASTKNLVVSIEWQPNLLDHFETGESLDDCLEILYSNDYKVYHLGSYSEDLSKQDVLNGGHVELLATRNQEFEKAKNELSEVKRSFVKKGVRDPAVVTKMVNNDVRTNIAHILFTQYEDLQFIRSQSSDYLLLALNNLLDKPYFTQYHYYNYCLNSLYNEFISSEIKIYDAFTYNGEVNLLNIRLALLNENIDYFVVVESNLTFTGKEKSLSFDITQHSLHKDKIIYIPVVDMPFPNAGDSGLAWHNENFQRNSVLAGMLNARDNDLIILSDVDEIPNIQNKEYFKDTVTQNNLVWISTIHFHFFLDNALCFNRNNDGICTELSTWIVSGAMSFGYINDRTPSAARIENSRLQDISWNDIGWHFSYVVSKNEILDKILSFSHTDIAAYMNDSELLSFNSIIDKVCEGGHGIFPVGTYVSDTDKPYDAIEITNDRIYSSELLSYIVTHEDTLDGYIISSSCN
jgi:beta-1,4-mannosyl-glycoprotein beta-1,4-N-acetylglucosaminyltransferase